MTARMRAVSERLNNSATRAHNANVRIANARVRLLRLAERTQGQTPEVAGRMEHHATEIEGALYAVETACTELEVELRHDGV